VPRPNRSVPRPASGARCAEAVPARTARRGSWRPAAGWVCAACLAPALAAGATPAPDGCPDDAPRTLVLALDGIPFRVVEQARAAGAFDGWPPAGRLIAPFPSVTNVAFTLILEAFGADPARGYEYQHFDVEHNRKSGLHAFGYRENSFAWRELFDSMGRSLGSKLAVYTIPWRKSRKELAAAERALLESPHELILAHVGSTDALQHLRGDRETSRLVRQLDDWIRGLKRRHHETRGRPLRVVLLSDHGNTAGKVRAVEGLRKQLRRAGLDVREHLRRDDDVVAPTFGLVSYGALYTRPENAERAARAVVEVPAVALAAWLASPGEVRVVSAEGSARVRWRDDRPARRFAYEFGGTDPLRLGSALERLTEQGRFDADGYAADEHWLEASALGDYPDPLERLVVALTGDHVLNRATVLLSLEPGTSWGLRSARFGSWLRGGRIEGTHGALDGESSFGFLMSDDPEFSPRPAVRASGAIAPLAAERLLASRCKGTAPVPGGDTRPALAAAGP